MNVHGTIGIYVYYTLYSQCTTMNENLLSITYTVFDSKGMQLHIPLSYLYIDAILCIENKIIKKTEQKKSVRVKFRILKSILRSKFVEHCTLCMVCCWERHDYQFWNGRLVIDTQFYRFKINKETYVSKKNIQKIHSVYYTV